MYSRFLILQRHVAGENKSIFHSFLHVRVASSMIQDQPPDQPARLKTTLGVSGHKQRISWSAEDGTGPTQLPGHSCWQWTRMMCSPSKGVPIP